MTRTSPFRLILVRLFLLALLVAFAYVLVAPWLRGQTEVNTIYGRRRSRARSSVNGTAVFAEMFSQAGSRVTTWHQLSPRLQRSDVIVWTPNSFELPDREQISYLETEWLGTADHRTRTLIYVGRDYDAALGYWEAQAQRNRGDAFLESRKQLAHEQSDHAYARSLTGKETTNKWFSIKSMQHFMRVKPSQGTWSKAIDAAAADIRVAGILEWPSAEESNVQYELLLGSAQTPLMVRLTDDVRWPNSQVLVLLNGFSVLNLPLINHEHRKLAGKLIEACGDPYRVTFLETGPQGPNISRQDPKAYSGFEALTVWPINSILLHLIVAGILYCLMVFPIFGRPRELDHDRTSDFGKHVRAVGDLLALAGDRQRAADQLRQYRALYLTSTPARHPASVTEPAMPGNPFKVSSS